MPDTLCAVIRTVVLAAMLGHIGLTQGAEVKVFTSRAIATVLEKNGREFERSSGHTLNVVTGFSPEFAKRIAAGEPFDIVVAPPSTLDALTKDGHIAVDSRTNLVRSGFGIAVRAGAPKPDLGSVDALKRALSNARSIGYIRTAGVPQLIEKLGMKKALEEKTTVPAGDTVAEMVAKGDLELGIIVITQIVTTPGVELAGPLPPEIQYHITFGAGIGARSKAPEAARALIDFLNGPATAAALEAQGLERAR